MEELAMQNKVWEQVIEFLNRLRCENISRDTSVRIPEYEEVQKELEVLREKCEEVIQQLPKEEQQMLWAWMEKAEDVLSLEGRKAYCQGYVDCILLLSGLGLLRQDILPEKLIEKLQ